jgi:hypothetical protein
MPAFIQPEVREGRKVADNLEVGEQWENHLPLNSYHDLAPSRFPTPICPYNPVPQMSNKQYDSLSLRGMIYLGKAMLL